MKRTSTSILLFLVILLQNSCTISVKVPLSKSNQKLHHSAEMVSGPYYSVKKKANFYTVIGFAGLGYLLGKASASVKDQNGVPYPQSKINENAFGPALLFGGLSLIACTTHPNTKKTFTEPIKPQEFDKWLDKYNNKNNQNFIKYRQDSYSYSYLLIPKQNVSAYEAEEKRIKDEAERQRVLAEKRKRDEEEKIVYIRILNGKEESLDSYLSLYKDGNYYDEVLEIAKSYSGFRKASKGKLQDVKNYLSIAENTFRRQEIERKLLNIEAFQKYSPERDKALAQIFGVNTPINVASALSILKNNATNNDFMSELWIELFNELGITETTSIKGNLSNKITQTAFLDIMDTDEFEGHFYWALYNSLISNNSESQSKGINMLKTFSEENNAMASYICGLINYQKQNYEEAIGYFEKAQKLGVIKGKTGLGVIYANKKYGLYNKNKAIEYFSQSYEGGDGDASFKMAQLYLSTMQDAEDQKLAVEWATKSIEKGNSGAMIFLGKVYAETKNGIRKDPEKVLYYFNKAASLGDVEAIFGLGLMYLDGEILDMKDQNKGLEYLKLASQRGKSKAMIMMAKLYDEGVLLPKSEIKARYWYNKALKYGEGKGAKNTEIESPLSAIFRLGDFSPSYTVTVNAYTGQEISRTQDLGSGLFGGIFSGIARGWLDRYENQQRTINGSELVETIGNKNIYAATLTSYVKSPIYVKKGSTITFNSTGNVSFGFISGGGDANGISGWREYSISPSISHGAVIWRISDGDWKLAGTTTSWESAYINSDGYMELAINDKDYSNNRGYFDVVIEVEK